MRLPGRNVVTAAANSAGVCRPDLSSRLTVRGSGNRSRAIFRAAGHNPSRQRALTEGVSGPEASLRRRSRLQRVGKRLPVLAGLRTADDRGMRALIDKPHIAI